MHPHRFQIGDRVVLNKPLLGLPTGTVGTVVMVYLSTTGCYDVQFDGDSELRVMFGPDLDASSPVAPGDWTDDDQTSTHNA